jgi:hypothetical protein
MDDLPRQRVMSKGSHRVPQIIDRRGAHGILTIKPRPGTTVACQSTASTPKRSSG